MSEWRGLNRLLVAFLGDGQQTSELLPALRRLRATLPTAHLAWLGPTESLPLDPAFPAFDSMVPYRYRDGAVLDNPVHERLLIDRVRRGDFQAAIVFTRPGESPWLLAYTCYLAGVPLRAGQSVEFGGAVLSHPIRPPDDGADRHLALVEALGLRKGNGY